MEPNRIYPRSKQTTMNTSTPTTGIPTIRLKNYEEQLRSTFIYIYFTDSLTVIIINIKKEVAIRLDWIVTVWTAGDIN